MRYLSVCLQGVCVNNKLLLRKGLLLANTLATTAINHVVPLKIMNPTDEVVSIPKGCDAVLVNTELLQDIREPVLDIIEESVEFNYMDNSCQTDETYESSRSLKAEMNVMKGTHQVELNKFVNFISSKEDGITKEEGENSKLKQQIKQQDSKIRCLEKEIRHKDNDLEINFMEKIDRRQYELGKKEEVYVC